MLCLPGVSIKDYISGSPVMLTQRAALRCPDPACESARLAGHGGYRRYLGGARRRVQRVRCDRCRVTHGVLPEDVCAHRDLTLGALESAWDASGPSAASRAVGAESVRTIRRNLKRLRGRSSLEVPRWLPAVAAGLDGLRRIFGTAPGVLVRLRRWLWSSQLLWFSGLCGLWRHGRPPHCDRRATHKRW